MSTASFCWSYLYWPCIILSALFCWLCHFVDRVICRPRHFVEYILYFIDCMYHFVDCVTFMNVYKIHGQKITQYFVDRIILFNMLAASICWSCHFANRIILFVCLGGGGYFASPVANRVGFLSSLTRRRHHQPPTVHAPYSVCFKHVFLLNVI